jgi:hypothetical protein
MTPQEAYKKFQIEVNKNDTNANVKIPKGVFVLLFNEQKRKWIDEIIKKNEGSDHIEDISELLEPDVELTQVGSNTRKTDYTLPDRFFRRVSGYSLASKDKCTNQVLYNWFIKPKDINVLLQNENQKPSFEYRETLAILNNGKISVYKDGFEIDKTFLSYYREPLDLDIEGYTKLDGSPSANVTVDLNDDNMETIINLTAAEAVRNTEAVEQLQLALQRLQPQP